MVKRKIIAMAVIIIVIIGAFGCFAYADGVTTGMIYGVYNYRYNFTYTITRTSDGLSYTHTPSYYIYKYGQSRISLADTIRVHDNTTSTYYSIEYNSSIYLDNPLRDGIGTGNSTYIKLPLHSSTTAANTIYSVEITMPDAYVYADTILGSGLQTGVTSNCTIQKVAYTFDVDFLTMGGEWRSVTFETPVLDTSNRYIMPKLSTIIGDGLLDAYGIDNTVPIHIYNYYATMLVTKTAASTAYIMSPNVWEYADIYSFSYGLTDSYYDKMDYYDALLTHDTSNKYELGYKVGKNEGYGNGYRVGKDEGYDEGYQRGKDDGLSEQYQSLSFTDWLGTSIQGVFDFQIMPNVSLGAVVVFVFGLALFVIIIRLMR